MNTHSFLPLACTISFNWFQNGTVLSFNKVSIYLIFLDFFKREMKNDECIKTQLRRLLWKVFKGFY